jgi:hypothetical protein
MWMVYMAERTLNTMIYNVSHATYVVPWNQAKSLPIVSEVFQSQDRKKPGNNLAHASMSHFWLRPTM